MSKTTAPKARAAKPAAKKKMAPPPRAQKPAAKKPALKKPAAKAAARPAVKAPPKPLARKGAAPAPARKAAAKTAAPAKRTPAPSPRPAARAHAPVKAPTPAAAVVKTTAPKPAARATPVRETSAKSPRALPSAAPAPPIVSSSRFADRFAPPRPAPRAASAPSGEEIVRQTFKADPKLANVWKTKPGRELSEAELLSMPDNEYMNDKQLDFFRARLQALKDDLLSNAGETTEHLREDTSIVPDPADRATIEEEHALELRTRDRERKLLKKISQSLARIDAGDYGFCDETGEPIGLGRLIARPTATLSLEAQQRRELKQKMFGD